MLGAIIGDVVGSMYEFDNIRTKDFPLFGEGCFFTDDTVMTVAAGEAVMNGGSPDDFIDAYKKWGNRYPHAGYGGRFASWLVSDRREPYNSFGNGSAMRVSPCGWQAALTQDIDAGLDETERLAAASAQVTHSHPEGITGAVETARAVYLMRRARAGEEYPANLDGWKDIIRRLSSYDLSASLDDIRPDYRFSATCLATVPQALTAFLESTGFEDAIRNAVSLGGDSDTLAAITGGIAEAAYGIPRELKERVWLYLDAPLRRACAAWYKYLQSR